jgi:glycosyltransferase involved in cell wall biosynthesis
MQKEENKKLPITAVMVIRNEETLLKRALLSCFNVVDEIIIVHDGKCEDKSLEIARKYTDKIFEREYIGQAEKHRVFTFEQASHDWILQLDADEYLSKELQNALEKLISNGADGFDVSWSTFHKNKHYFWFRKRILFRKSKIYFIGISHEFAKPIGKNVLIKTADFPLFHKPRYDNSTLAVVRTKWKKWAKIHASQLIQDFEKIPKWNCSFSDWELHRRARIKHPLVLGMLATPLYHSFFATKSFLRHKKFLIIKLSLLASMYHLYLYYYIFKYKRNEKKYL